MLTPKFPSFPSLCFILCVICTLGGLWLATRGGDLFFNNDEKNLENFKQVNFGARGFGILDVGFQPDGTLWAAGGSGTCLFHSLSLSLSLILILILSKEVKKTRRLSIDATK